MPAENLSRRLRPAAAQPVGAHSLSRRAAFGLAGTTAAGAALVLAGCAPTASGNGGTGSGGTGSGTGTGGTGGASSGTPVRVAALSAIPVGGALAAEANGQQLLLTQPTAGDVHAFSAICTHQGCTVAPSGAKLVCPCHDSVFDETTGEPTSGPAQQALPKFTVTVSGDDVSVAI